MEKDMKKKKTLAEELSRIGDWFHERDLSMWDVIRRTAAVAMGMLVGALALVAWVLAIEAFGMAIQAGSFGWVIGGVAISGVALLATCGMALLVWMMWMKDER